MCLLAVLFGVHPDAPLIVAANRDELIQRPAVPMTVLRPAGPRILGGQDEIAGGTWMATNEHGVVAALTNVPAERDPTRRSRGELPLMLASHESAEAAAAAFAAEVKPQAYSPCWILVGDASSLHYVDVTGAAGASPAARQLEPGVYVLENHPLTPQSDKASAVSHALEGVMALTGTSLTEGLRQILSSHQRGEGAPAHRAACVHGEGYGTRSSSIAVVRAGAVPQLLYTEGPPCRASLRDAAELWA